MIRFRACYNVYSDLNPQIDFCVLTEDDEYSEVTKKIIETAFDDWFSNESDDTIADYISRTLLEAGITHEIYFKDEEYIEN